jgi:RNA polymerase sigma-70 factor, ECF subfamily
VSKGTGVREQRLDTALTRDDLAEQSSPGTSQENAWISASQKGDDVAFNRLVLKWEKPIYNLSLRMLQSPEEAAEAAQETFMSAYRSIRRFRLEARFSTWIYRIAVNHCITRLRRRPPGVHYSIDDESVEVPWSDRLSERETQERNLLRDEGRRQVHEAMERLSPEQRAVVELKFFQDLTFEEIAGVLEVPLSTIKSRLYAGLETLKSRLGRLGVEA